MTTMTTHTLTKRDVRALRAADALCFDHDPNGTGQIRAILRAENSSTGFEQTHTIPALVSVVKNYGSWDAPWRCFAMIMSAKYSDIGQTLVRHLKEGTEFALEWTRDNSSPVTRETGICRDELRVRVRNRTITDTFLVEVFVGRDNSARMVKRA